MAHSVRESVSAGLFRYTLRNGEVLIRPALRGLPTGRGPCGTLVSMHAGGGYKLSVFGGRSSGERDASPPSFGTVPPAWSGWGGSGTSVSEHPTALARRLEEARSRIDWGWPIAVGGFLLGLFTGAWFWLVWLIAAAAAWWAFSHAQAMRLVPVMYDSAVSSRSWFEALNDEWLALSGSARLDRLDDGGGSSELRVDTSGPRALRTNVSVPTLWSGSESLSFLPDRILAHDGKRFFTYDYSAASFSSGWADRSESQQDVVPGATVIGEQRQHQKRDGSLDRRFRNNPLVLTVRYGVLRVVIQDGPTWITSSERGDLVAAIAQELSRRSRS